MPLWERQIEEWLAEKPERTAAADFDGFWDETTIASPIPTAESRGRLCGLPLKEAICLSGLVRRF